MDETKEGRKEASKKNIEGRKEGRKGMYRRKEWNGRKEGMNERKEGRKEWNGRKEGGK